MENGLPRVVVVDDHKGVAEALEWLFRQRKVCQVVGIATSPDEGRAICAETLPDLIILDLSFPNGSGVDLLREIRAKYPSIKALVYSGCFKEAILLDAISLFPQGFVSKNSSLDTLIEAVNAVCTGKQTFYCAATSDFLKKINGSFAEQLRALSEKERKILTSIVAGEPSKAIALDLGISQRSVDTFRARLMGKLGAKEVASLTRMAICCGLVPENRLV